MIEKEFGDEIHNSIFYLGKTLQKVKDDLNDAFLNSPKAASPPPTPPFPEKTS